MRKLAALALALFTATPAWTCSCGKESPEGAFSDAAAVVLVTAVTNEVIPRENMGPYRRVHLRIEKIWKSDGRSLDFVVTNAYGAGCGLPFEVGERYILFAQRPRNPGIYREQEVLEVSECSLYLQVTPRVDCAKFPSVCAESETHVASLLKFLDKAAN